MVIITQLIRRDGYGFDLLTQLRPFTLEWSGLSSACVRTRAPDLVGFIPDSIAIGFRLSTI